MELDEVTTKWTHLGDNHSAWEAPRSLSLPSWSCPFSPKITSFPIPNVKVWLLSECQNILEAMWIYYVFFKNGKKEILPQGHEGLFLPSFRSVMVLPLGGLDPSPFSFCVRPGKGPSLAPLRAWCFHLAPPLTRSWIRIFPSRDCWKQIFSVSASFFFFF